MRGDGLNDVLVPAYGLAEDEDVSVGKHSSSLRFKLLGDLLAGANEMGPMVGTQVGDVRLGKLSVSEEMSRIVETVADVAKLRQCNLRVLATDYRAQEEGAVGDLGGEVRQPHLLRLATDSHRSGNRLVKCE